MRATLSSPLPWRFWKLETNMSSNRKSSVSSNNRGTRVLTEAIHVSSVHDRTNFSRPIETSENTMQFACPLQKDFKDGTQLNQQNQMDKGPASVCWSPTLQSQFNSKGTHSRSLPSKLNRGPHLQKSHLYCLNAVISLKV